MAKRAAMWMGCLAAGGLLLAVTLHPVARVRAARNLLRREVLAWAAPAPPATPATDSSQAVTPRDPDFLKPQRLDAWQIVGPGGGGTFYRPAISPHDPNLVFTTTDMTGCYVSENGGRTWRLFNLRMTCTFVFDPKLPNRVYALAGGAGLWRTDDRGHTWSLVYPEAASVWYADDEAEVSIYTSCCYADPALSLAVDPDDSNTLYVSYGGELRVSKDAGKHWKSLAPDAYATQLWVNPASPREKRVLYTLWNLNMGTWDGAKYVKRVIEGTGNVYGSAFGTPSGGGKMVIYTANDYLVKDGELKGGGILATDDGGVTWRSLNAGLLKLVAKGSYPNFTAMGASRKHGEVLYVSIVNFVPANEQKSYYGVVKTTDGGATWTIVRKESGANAPNMHHDWIASRWGPDWGDQPLGIAVDDNNPDLVYTTDLGRVMRSVDGGQNWVGVYSQSTGKGYTTTGLDVTTCYGVHFDPFDPKRMFISYTDIGLVRSEDGGESWLSVTANGVPRRWENTTYWLEFDPAVKGKMWAVMSGMHDLPRHRMLRFLPDAAGGVVLSVDGGNTWTVSNHGLPEMPATHILLDPKSPVDARVLYVTGMGKGVFKSSDGGRNWAAKNNGLPQKPLTWRLAADRDGTLYLVTIRLSEDGKYGNDQDGWLFRSRDGAETWERVPLPPGVNGPMGITVDPRDPARLYLAVWARYTLYATGAPAPDGGVFLSTDGGHRWENVLNGSRHMYDVTVDPRNPDLVYASGFEPSAWRSTDRGKTWSRIRGYNFKDGHRVIPDPLDISKIYITTFGSSVWHGPADGDPNAVEDIVAPPPMMFRNVAPKSK